MKILLLTITASLLLISPCCKQKLPDYSDLLEQIGNELNAGNLKKVKILTDSLKTIYPEEKRLINKADSFSQIADRIALDFSVTENEADIQLKERLGSFTPEEKALWEKKEWLEWRAIDGNKRYFKRAASNLRLIKDFYLQRAQRDTLEARDPEIIYRKKHTQAIIKESDNQCRPVVPVDMTLTYMITVKPDVVPAGEIVRCWLPYPKENNARQKNIRFNSASNKDFQIAPDSAVHKTIYMQERAEKGIPLVFIVSFSYQSSGQYFDPGNSNILPYNKSSILYKEYTSEQLPHICFTENVRHLADSLTGSEERPFEIVKKIYSWFNRNILWTGALEYSTMPNIPEYVLKNKRGDCGMQTFLFMSMLRYKGIPVKWQSGWMVPPDAENRHDWCEVYFEGPGWVPADVYYGLQYSIDQKTREFYISGTDSYRLIINDGISGTLYPEKKFLRSDPVDFQIGEVEWNGGNLYYDKWNYSMKIEYRK
jgi:hypothetical protein